MAKSGFFLVGVVVASIAGCQQPLKPAISQTEVGQQTASRAEADQSQETTPENEGEYKISFQGGGMIYVALEKFDPAGHEVKGGDRIEGKAGKNWIDGVEVFGGSGSDQENFSRRGESISVWVGEKVFEIPEELCRDLMDLNLVYGSDYAGAFLEPNLNVLYFFIEGGDAGGAYTANFSVNLETLKVKRTIGSESYIENTADGVCTIADSD